MTAKCVECGREFDLLVEEEADEWTSGHDCESGETFPDWRWAK
jgi:DNA-directed RNA polymerase subunit RPC12/RpoP